jgi:hypothetical protein
MHRAANERDVDELVEPIERSKFGHRSKGRRVLAERDDEATCEGTQGQQDADDLHDVLGGQEVTDEQPERGEQGETRARRK